MALIQKALKSIAFVSNEFFTATLRSDGTVALAGNGSHLNGVDGELKVEDWTDVMQIENSSIALVGLRTDGTVVGTSTRNHDTIQHVFSDWRTITDVS